LIDTAAEGKPEGSALQPAAAPVAEAPKAPSPAAQHQQQHMLQEHHLQQQENIRRKISPSICNRNW
jgi:hypothetical protein